MFEVPIVPIVVTTGIDPIVVGNMSGLIVFTGSFTTILG